ncbi:hypothetical protein RGQ29_003456 [Quercus rubra]|uniref:VQ domain-containing protein n=1 Tax=Quercus rubra TaxID=3512 RepID=A0AAN7IEH2_QUERU|nr:hypothetical protein RGQ29_003456 [Quercus rubra]
MSPTQFHAKKDVTNNALCPPPLKVNKDSHFIKKSSAAAAASGSVSSSSSTSSLINSVAGSAKPQQRHPVIIYTHSPKVIHTHPRDFMALVQKLTGQSRSEDHDTARQKSDSGGNASTSSDEENKSVKIVGNDDNESSSVVTDENCSSLGDGQVNSCFVPPIFETPNPYMTNIPFFTPNSAEFLCSNQPFYNYTDSLFFAPNMRSSVSSSSNLEGIREFREY